MADAEALSEQRGFRQVAGGDPAPAQPRQLGTGRARTLGRGRQDDTDEAIARRLALYEQETRPVLEFFAERDLLVTVDGVGSEREVSQRLFDAVDAARAS